MFWHIKYITRRKKGEEEKDLLSIQNKLAQPTKFQKSHTWVCGFSIPMTTLDLKKKIKITRVTSVWQNTAVQFSREGKVFGLKYYLRSRLHMNSASLCATPPIGWVLASSNAYITLNQFPIFVLSVL